MKLFNRHVAALSVTALAVTAIIVSSNPTHTRSLENRTGSAHNGGTVTCADSVRAAGSPGISRSDSLLKRPGDSLVPHAIGPATGTVCNPAADECQ